MKKEGFIHDRPEYVKVLKLMAHLGFGKLETDSKGRVTALTDIKVTLQSIGEAAMGQTAELLPWKQRNKFKALSAARPSVLPPKEQPELSPVFPVSLTVVINGKAVDVGVPNNLNERDIAALVVRLRS